MYVYSPERNQWIDASAHRVYVQQQHTQHKRAQAASSRWRRRGPAKMCTHIFSAGAARDVSWNIDFAGCLRAFHKDDQGGSLCVRVRAPAKQSEEVAQWLSVRIIQTDILVLHTHISQKDAMAHARQPIDIVYGSAACGGVYFSSFLRMYLSMVRCVSLRMNAASFETAAE